ncbi:ATP-binding cassette sub-family A member 2-like [Pollicipes pollicipes]|uniref:ATP-binding cassette sub-family A member 2-like n=1 Tax=Pollicipes pollicipes TaxID=41117 RepID=UPI0018853475|nr:ATP-binding cassette sub-family A member 2-like [Pollicipes pollicipes]
MEDAAGRWPPTGPAGAPASPPADVCDDALGPRQNRTQAASAILLWVAVQELVCGQTPDLPPQMNTTADFVEYLGLDDSHKGRLAILFHMLSRNPRVLFSPNTTQAWRIVAKVNETVEYLDGLTKLARQILSLPQPLPDTLPVPGWQVTLVSCAWLELMAGAQLDLFRPYPTEAAAVDYFLDGAAADNVSVLAVLALDLPSDGRLPNHLIYKIRQNATLVANTVLVRDRAWLPGPRNWDYNYYEFGFSWLQDLVERAVAALHAGRTVLEPASAIHEMPYPCYVQDRFLFDLETVVPLCLTLGWVCGVALQVQQLVQERDDRLREVMLTLGVSLPAIRASWVLTSLLLTTPSAVAAALVLCYGGILRYSSVSLVLCLLLLFVIDNTALAHLLSALSMGRARTAASSSVILYFLTYVPYVYVSVVENTAMLPVSSPVKVLTCLMSPSAFNLAFKYIGFYEQQGTGVDWSSWTVSPVENDSFNMAITMLIMLLDPLLYAVLVWYIENVFPGDVGVPQPWYFLLSPGYWRPTPTKPGSGEWDTADADGGLLNEPEPTKLPLAVELCALTKRFPGQRRPAVDRLSLRLYEGQVTALLGHNGAGKTTTLSILSGLLPACSGSVSVYGCDTRRRLAAARRSLGFCPQQDVLFDGLTPAEHVWFYGRMRGAGHREALLQAFSVLADVNLLPKRDCDVRLLSGGQRRKLSVAIAFLGGSRCIVLDEPTAGVDPHSRRAIWSLIAKYKPGRTILFCTHHMEEADVLGNRIAILSAGKVKCVGSPMFLRRQLGAGYHLHVVRTAADPSEDGQASGGGLGGVTSLLQAHVPSAQLLGSSAHELHFFLPVAELTAGVLPRLLEALQQRREELAVASFGLQTTSMEEVFMRVTRNGQDDCPVPTPTSDTHSELADVVLLPAIFTFLAMSLAVVTPNVSDKPPLVMAPTQYFNYTSPQENVVPVANNWLDVLNPGFSRDAPSPAVEATLELASGLGATCVRRDPHNASAGFDPLCDTVRHRACSCRPDGAGQACAPGGYRLPLSRSVVTGDLLQNVSGQPESEFYRATTDIYRLRRYGGLSLGLVHAATPPEFGRHLSPAARRTAVRRRAKAWFNHKGLHAVPAYVNALNNAVLRANLPPAAGDPAAYGVTCVNHPLPRTGAFTLEEEIRQGTDILIALFVLVALSFVNCSVPSAACLLIIAAFNDPAYTSGSNLAAVTLLVFFYGVSSVFSLTRSSPAMKQTRPVQLVAGWGISRGSRLPALVFNRPALKARSSWAFSSVVPYTCEQSIQPHSIGDSLPSGPSRWKMGEMDRSWSMNWPKVTTDMVKIGAGWSMTPLMYPASFLFREPGSAYIAVVMFNLFLGAAALLTTSLFESIEDQQAVNAMKSVFLVLPNYCLGRGLLEIAYNQYHNDFLVKTARPLTKVYRGAGTAVDQLCFGVAPGECFGLLGVNGAGKTSTFRMLTGDKSVTSGDALVKLQCGDHSRDVSLRQELDTALSEMGYCPQHDALHGEMTVSEHLTVYAMIRGVPPARLRLEVDRLLRQLGLVVYARRPAAVLSGGNKRKLSTALALVGAPRLVLLDEPTTGMDPASRRYLWELVRRLVAAGRSVLLTSHSMEECEALCTRLAVMVNGRLRCLGSPQHLRNRFGDGYTVTIRSGEADPDAVDRRVKACLPFSRLKECHLNVWTYELGSDAAPLGEVLRRLERLAAQLRIDDYYVSQNTLDSVFVSLARHQSECPGPEERLVAPGEPLDDRVVCKDLEPPPAPRLLTVRL